MLTREYTSVYFFVVVVDNSFLGDLFENGIIYDHLNF